MLSHSRHLDCAGTFMIPLIYFPNFPFHRSVYFCSWNRVGQLTTDSAFTQVGWTSLLCFCYAFAPSICLVAVGLCRHNINRRWRSPNLALHFANHPFQARDKANHVWADITLTSAHAMAHSLSLIRQHVRRLRQHDGQTRGQWPYRPASIRAMMYYKVVLYDFIYNVLLCGVVWFQLSLYLGIYDL